MGHFASPAQSGCSQVLWLSLRLHPSWSRKTGCSALKEQSPRYLALAQQKKPKWKVEQQR
ncbi:Uncharacterised protein [Vibrio cholerae]|nr:Uncharacterised protein [Vibrio cholerae]